MTPASGTEATRKSVRVRPVEPKSTVAKSASTAMYGGAAWVPPVPTRVPGARVGAPQVGGAGVGGQQGAAGQRAAAEQARGTRRARRRAGRAKSTGPGLRAIRFSRANCSISRKSPSSSPGPDSTPPPCRPAAAVASSARPEKLLTTWSTVARTVAPGGGKSGRSSEGGTAPRPRRWRAASRRPGRSSDAEQADDLVDAPGPAPCRRGRPRVRSRVPTTIRSTT